MTRRSLYGIVALGITLLLSIRTVPFAKQSASPTDSGPVVPRLINFSGVLRDVRGQVPPGVIGVTLSLYKDQQGGVAVWTENQNIQLDEQGRYSVLLGATQASGIPTDLFVSGESRWLGVQAQLPGEQEQPRVLLVSVPYALHAANADTIGGKPPSAFVLAGSADQTQSGDINGQPSTINRPQPRDATLTGATGTPNALTKWLNANGDLGDSHVYEVNGNVGVNNPNPVGQFDLAGASSLVAEAGGLHVTDTNVTPNKVIQIGYDDASDVGFIRAYRSTTGPLENLVLNPQGGNVGVGTTNPVGQLDISTQASYFAEAGGFHVTNNATNPSKVTQMGYDNNIDAGFIRAYQASTGLKPLLLNPQGGFVGIGTITPSQALEINGTAKVTRLMFGDNTTMTTAAAALGPNTFTGNQTVAGNVQITGGNSVIFSDGTSLSSAYPARIRTITYLGGCDSCSTLTTSDSQRQIYINLTGAMTINSVTCFSDAGSPVINLQRDNGTPTNILNIPGQNGNGVTCSPGGTTTSSFASGQAILNLNDQAHFVMVFADGVAKRVTVAIQATVN